MASGAARVPPPTRRPSSTCFRVGSADCATSRRVLRLPGVRVEVSPGTASGGRHATPTSRIADRPPLPSTSRGGRPTSPRCSSGSFTFATVRRAPPRRGPIWAATRERRCGVSTNTPRDRRRFASTSYCPRRLRSRPSASPRTTREPRRRAAGRAGGLGRRARRPAPRPFRGGVRRRCTPTLNLSARNHRRDW